MRSETPIADICLLGHLALCAGWRVQLGEPADPGAAGLYLLGGFIGGQREAYGERQYRIPANVVHIEEHFWKRLASSRGARPGRARRRGRDLAADASLSARPGIPDEALGEGLLDTLASGRLRLEDVLRSRSSWEAITEGYTRHCSDPRSSITSGHCAPCTRRSSCFRGSRPGYRGRGLCIRSRPDMRGCWGPCCSVAGSVRTCSANTASTQGTQDRPGPGQLDIEGPDEALRTGTDTEFSYIRNLWIRFFERIGLLTYRAADPIISLYAGNRQRQIADGAHPSRTRVIPNGIAMAAWADALQRRPAGIAPVVGLVGRVVPIRT